MSASRPLFSLCMVRYSVIMGSHLSFNVDHAAKIAGLHHGDMASMAIIEFVDRDADAIGAGDKARVAAEDGAE